MGPWLGEDGAEETLVVEREENVVLVVGGEENVILVVGVNEVVENDEVGKVDEVDGDEVVKDNEVIRGDEFIKDDEVVDGDKVVDGDEVVNGGEKVVLVEAIVVVLLANVVDLLSGSSGLLSPSSSSRDSGARVHAGPSEVSVLVFVTVVVVSKPGIAPPHAVTVASIIGRHTEEIIVDEVPRRLDGSADTLNPSVHHTKRSVMTVL